MGVVLSGDTVVIFWDGNSVAWEDMVSSKEFTWKFRCITSVGLTWECTNVVVDVVMGPDTWVWFLSEGFSLRKSMSIVFKTMASFVSWNSDSVSWENVIAFKEFFRKF